MRARRSAFLPPTQSSRPQQLPEVLEDAWELVPVSDRRHRCLAGLVQQVDHPNPKRLPKHLHAEGDQLDERVRYWARKGHGCVITPTA